MHKNLPEWEILTIQNHCHHFQCIIKEILQHVTYWPPTRHYKSLLRSYSHDAWSVSCMTKYLTKHRFVYVYVYLLFKFICMRVASLLFTWFRGSNMNSTWSSENLRDGFIQCTNFLCQHIHFLFHVSFFFIQCINELNSLHQNVSFASLQQNEAIACTWS